MEKSGVIDALTKGIYYKLISSSTPLTFFKLLLILLFCHVVLVGLYEEPERPSNAVDYIKRYMGAPAGVDVEALRAEVEQLRADKAKLEAQVKEMSQVGNP